MRVSCDFLTCEGSISTFLDKFIFIEYFAVPVISEVLYYALRERCNIGTLFVTFFSQMDIFDLPCRVIMRRDYSDYRHITSQCLEFYQFHSKNIIEIIDYSGSIYDENIIRYKRHINSYQIVSRGEILDISGIMVQTIRLIVPGEFISTNAKSARK